MTTQLRIGVAGATGSLGREVLDVLGEQSWRPESVVALSHLASETTSVDYNGESVGVDDLATQAFGELDVLVVLLPAAHAKAVIDRAVQEGCSVIDASGVGLDDLQSPFTLPWVQAQTGGSLPARDVVTTPSAAATLVASVLAPLARAGWVDRAQAHVMVPASVWGHKAVDELSRQVVAMFNAQPPPRKVFPSGFAFDLLPLVGEVGASGWTDAESRVALEIARLIRLPCDVTLTGVPVFSGISSSVEVVLPEDVPLEALGRVWQAAHLQFVSSKEPRLQPHPIRMTGSSSIAIGRLRRSLHDPHAHFWASMDNLRVGAEVVVQTLQERLVARGLIEAEDPE